MISAIILSAGASFRMGSPKALLTIGGKTFLQNIADEILSVGIQEIVIVLGADAEIIQQSLNWFHGNVVINANWREGQLSSIIAGLNHIQHETCDGILICPVDHPLISHNLITDLLQAFQKDKKNIIVPVYQNRRGHPIIFPSKYFDEIQHASLEVGAREVVRNHPNEIVEVATNESGIAVNIDTPHDYDIHILKTKS